MKTQPVDDNGTDLIKVIRNIAPEINVLFFAERNDERTMNFIYNMADVTINIASNEGLVRHSRIIDGRYTNSCECYRWFTRPMGFKKEEVHFL